MVRAALPLLITALLVGCNRDEEIEYEQFNANDDTIEIEVGVDELLDFRRADLRSSTDSVDIGWVEVDPGGGPIGTNHVVSVEVFDAWAGEGDRVSVRTTPPDDDREIAEDEYDLVQDSADEGYYKITLESVGDPGEVRTDTFTIRVWRIVGEGIESEGGTDGS